jgi:hypothetical protein
VTETSSSPGAFAVLRGRDWRPLLLAVAILAAWARILVPGPAMAHGGAAAAQLCRAADGGLAQIPAADASVTEAGCSFCRLPELPAALGLRAPLLLPAMERLARAACQGASAVIALTPGFDRSTARDAPDGAPDAVVERFDVQRSSARATIAGAVTETARARAQTLLPGSRVRNCHVAVVPHRLVSRRLGMPAYVLAYRYENKSYRAVVHGQDVRLVLGHAPLSIGKIVAVVLAVVLVLVALIGIFGGK